jgi:Rps23 Pro-64 3,4-dihydroxylase Tpa1-like proline 4-hydroxylase
VDINYALNKLNPELIKEYPFKHFLVKNFLYESDFEKIYEDLILLESTVPSKEFKSNFGTKKEWKSPHSTNDALQKCFNFFQSDEFIEKLELMFGLDSTQKLFGDPSYDGGGYVKSPPGSYLSYHADFNFSSVVGKYRSVNVLFYANKEYSKEDGGILHGLDSESKTVEVEVLPEANCIFAFITDDLAFHGVTRNRANFSRRSFNLYYYTERPISNRQSIDPHKTIWLDFGEHTH